MLDTSCAGIGGDLHVCARTSDGKFLHAIRKPDGSWDGFNDGSGISNAGSDNGSVDCSDAGGTLHVCLRKNDGRFFHAIRRPNGSWIGFNDASGIPNAGSDNEAIACAGIGTELHVCLRKTDGRFFHAIRLDSGAWQGFNDASSIHNAGADNVEIACAEVSGELHVCLRKLDGRFFHAIRHANGAWSGFNDASGIPNAGSDNALVACAGVAGELHVCLRKNDGRLFHALRRADGSWDGFNDASWLHGGVDISRMSMADIGGALHVCLGTNAGSFFHAIRRADGSWDGFNNGTSLLNSPAPSAHLNPGDEVVSGSGNARLIYQGDGNLVLYVRRDAKGRPDPAGTWAAAWASDTYGQPAGHCVMQGDGNLVVYRPDGSPAWSSNTWGNPGATLVVQDDENVVIYGPNGNALWSTTTWIGAEKMCGFDPAVRGFKFINDFADGFWQIGAIQFSTRGLCGGMSFTALDFYYAGKPIPTATTTPSAVSDPLGQYINGRQQQSVETNLGGWAVQILNPDDNALHHWATHDEWTKVKNAIDAGNPVALGLGVYLNGSASHQVVAAGYREGGSERWIITYDPNRPARRSVLHLRKGARRWRDYRVDDQGQLLPDWRGYFVSSYGAQSPP